MALVASHPCKSHRRLNFFFLGSWVPRTPAVLNCDNRFPTLVDNLPSLPFRRLSPNNLRISRGSNPSKSSAMETLRVWLGTISCWEWYLLSQLL